MPISPGVALMRLASDDVGILASAFSEMRRLWLDVLGRQRRWIVAALLGLAVMAGLQAEMPQRAPSRSVWVAASDLRGGDPLSAADLRAEALPVGAIPTGAVPATQSLVGRLLAAPMRRGEPFTDWRLLDSPMLQAIGAGRLAVSIRVADGAELSGLIQVGEHVAAYATGDEVGVAARARVVAAGLLVLALSREDTSGAADVVVAADPAQAARLTSAAANSSMSVAVQPPTDAGGLRQPP